jgi:hypothetical protein
MRYSNRRRNLKRSSSLYESFLHNNPRPSNNVSIKETESYYLSLLKEITQDFIRDNCRSSSLARRNRDEKIKNERHIAEYEMKKLVEENESVNELYDYFKEEYLTDVFTNHSENIIESSKNKTEQMRIEIIILDDERSNLEARLRLFSD